MAYGIANRDGQTPTNEVRDILELARKAGVCSLDTARAYGQSEEVIGSLTAGDSHWRIITKITPDLPDDKQAMVAATEGEPQSEPPSASAGPARHGSTASAPIS